jgi:hypothetical protein
MTPTLTTTGTTSGATSQALGDRTYRALGDYASYEQAQRVVDGLSDAGFPVMHVRIVGHGLRSVEQVAGRLTKGRAAGAGAASGAWFGLLVGLLLGLFAPGAAWLPLLLTAVVVSAVWGAVFGFLAHAATRGRRDFVSARALQADRYTVEVDSGYADEAARLAPVV